MPPPLLHVALHEPRIPQNTGNLGRLVLAMGARLHLVGRLGFRTDDRACRRAGLDYWPHLDWRRHEDLEDLAAALPDAERVFAFTTRSDRSYADVAYRPGDCLLFGDEVRGLPQAVVDAAGERAVRIPLASPRVRSLNLANAAAIAVAEAIRQIGIPEPAPARPPHDAALSRQVPCRPS